MSPSTASTIDGGVLAKNVDMEDSDDLQKPVLESLAKAKAGAAGGTGFDTFNQAGAAAKAAAAFMKSRRLAFRDMDEPLVKQWLKLRRHGWFPHVAWTLYHYRFVTQYR